MQTVNEPLLCSVSFLVFLSYSICFFSISHTFFPDNFPFRSHHPVSSSSSQPILSSSAFYLLFLSFFFLRWLGFISFLQHSTVSELCPQSRIGFTAYIHSFLPNANTSALVMLFYHLQGILRNLHRDKTFLSWNLSWYDDYFVTAKYWIFCHSHVVEFFELLLWVI